MARGGLGIAALLVLGLVGGGSPVRGAVQNGERSVDVKHSSATFRVTHLYLATVTGIVPIAGGTIDLPAGAVIPAHLAATLDPKRIKSGDDERDGDLQGADWFDTKRFPTWTYSSSKIAADGPSHFTVEGSLTVHGIAQPMTLGVEVVRGLPVPRYHATGHVDRHGFGMAVTRIDPLVGTDITIVLDVSAE